MEPRGSIFLVVAVLALAFPGMARAQSAKAILTQEDLPKPRYPADSALALLRSDDTAFNRWAMSIGKSAADTLSAYRIDDLSARRTLLARLKWAQMLNGENEAALRTIALIREAEEKTDAKLVSGLLDEAVVRARLETAADSGPAYQGAVSRRFRMAIAAMPFTVAGTRLKELKNRQEINSPNVFLGIISNEIEPAVIKMRSMDGDSADFVLRAKVAERIYWPLRPVTVAALRDVIRSNTVRKPDIWPARDVVLTAADRLSPVVVGIWDTGVDPALFPGRMYPTTKGLGGAPGNGFGPSFDLVSRPTGGTLRPRSAADEANFRETAADLQGFQDNEAAIDSAAAEAFRARIAALSADDAPSYLKRLGEVSDYIHGTHIAGIVARGNPAVRLAVIRHTTWSNDDVPMTAGEVDNIVAKMSAVSTFVRANRVRVVNMSWVAGPGGYEAAVARDQPNLDAEARKRLARSWFSRVRDAFIAVLRANPETLFVAGAGNSDSDNAFDQTFPSSLTAPNLIVVGGVDQAGDEMSMSSTGRNVAVGANGYHVASVIPGGAELAGTGTSMAAPQVANLAAKLLALRPTLTPAQLIGLIEGGATRSGDGRIRIINPKASIGSLRSTKSLGGALTFTET